MAATQENDPNPSANFSKYVADGLTTGSLNFPSPLYISGWISESVILVGGGGGGSRFGMGNFLALLEISPDVHSSSWYRVLAVLDLGDDIIWCSSAMNEVEHPSRWAGGVMFIAVSHVDCFSVIKISVKAEVKGDKVKKLNWNLTRCCRVPLITDVKDPDKKPIALTNQQDIFVVQDEPSVIYHSLLDLLNEEDARLLLIASGANQPGAINKYRNDKKKEKVSNSPEKGKSPAGKGELEGKLASLVSKEFNGRIRHMDASASSLACRQKENSKKRSSSSQTVLLCVLCEDKLIRFFLWDNEQRTVVRKLETSLDKSNIVPFKLLKSSLRFVRFCASFQNVFVVVHDVYGNSTYIIRAIIATDSPDADPSEFNPKQVRYEISVIIPKDAITDIDMSGFFWHGQMLMGSVEGNIYTLGASNIAEAAKKVEKDVSKKGGDDVGKKIFLRWGMRLRTAIQFFQKEAPLKILQCRRSLHKEPISSVSRHPKSQILLSTDIGQCAHVTQLPNPLDFGVADEFEVDPSKVPLLFLPTFGQRLMSGLCKLLFFIMVVGIIGFIAMFLFFDNWCSLTGRKCTNGKPPTLWASTDNGQ